MRSDHDLHLLRGLKCARIGVPSRSGWVTDSPCRRQRKRTSQVPLGYRADRRNPASTPLIGPPLVAPQSVVEGLVDGDGSEDVGNGRGVPAAAPGGGGAVDVEVVGDRLHAATG